MGGGGGGEPPVKTQSGDPTPEGELFFALTAPRPLYELACDVGDYEAGARSPAFPRPGSTTTRFLPGGICGLALDVPGFAFVPAPRVARVATDFRDVGAGLRPAPAGRRRP